MRSAVIRVLFLVILALGGVASSAAIAGAQLVDPIGTVTSAISPITSQTTVVSDLTGSVTGATSGGSGGTGAVSGATGAVSGATGAVSGATGAVSGATDAVSGSGSLSGSGTTSLTSSGADGGSGSASGGAASSGSATDSNRGSPQTRFDRLPRRYERLLERIESGRHVRANIARLQALLASASPQLRARVMRQIRLEIRRLERGGLTRRERAAVRRLRALLTRLQAPAPRPATPSSSALGRVEGSGILGATVSAGGVSAASAGSESAGSRPTNGRDEGSSANPRLRPPWLPPSPHPSYWPLLLLVLAAVASLVLLLTGPPRHLLPAPVRGVVDVRRPEVLALAVAIGLGAYIYFVESERPAGGIEEKQKVFTVEADKIDPVALAAKVPAGTPVLLTCSDSDSQAKCDAERPLIDALKHTALTVVELKGVNHVLRDDPTDNIANYAKQDPLSPQLVSALDEFVGK